MPQFHLVLNRYLAKLGARSTIPPSAIQAFLALDRVVESFDTYRELIREDEPTRGCCLMAAGMVSRYKTLRNGGRQIVSFHIAGDMIDLQSCLMKRTDHGVRAHTPVTIVRFGHEDVLRLAESFPELGRALWFETLIDAAIFREWMLNVGRRSGRERVAHLLLEFAFRMKGAGLGDGSTFVFPVTQADLADAVGMSPVHVNRSLQWLRGNGLIRTVGKAITIVDRPGMIALTDFHDTYLHPDGPREIEPI